MKRFSRSFPTFFDWKNKTGTTLYARKIERSHYRYPNATLSQLTGRKKLPRRQIPLYKIDPRGLKPQELVLRNKALRVRTQLKKKRDLNTVLKEEEITKEILLKYLGNSIKIKGNHAIVRKSDEIPRMMVIDEKGMEYSIVIRNSKDASIIGKYHNAKRRFLETGDVSVFDKFKKIKIKDADGLIHTLETNPEKIYEIEDRKERPEGNEIYTS